MALSGCGIRVAVRASIVMAMRETPRSLRAYFLFIGVLVVLGAGLEVTRRSFDIVSWLSIARMLTGFAYLGLGLFTHRLLRTAPQAFYYVLVANLFVVTLCTVVVAAYIDVDVPTLLGLSLTGIITVYLFNSVRRLSAEARSATTP